MGERGRREMGRERSMSFSTVHLHTVLYQPVRTAVFCRPPTTAFTNFVVDLSVPRRTLKVQQGVLAANLKNVEEDVSEFLNVCHKDALTVPQRGVSSIIIAQYLGVGGVSMRLKKMFTRNQRFQLYVVRLSRFKPPTASHRLT